MKLTVLMMNAPYSQEANIVGNVHGESAATVGTKLRMMTWLQGAKM